MTTSIHFILSSLKELDPTAMRFGFVAGAIFVLLLLLAAKIFTMIQRAKTSPGVTLPSSQSTFISTRAIFDLVEIEMVTFTSVRVLSKALYKSTSGHVLTLNIAYDLSQNDFPDIEKRLKEHLFGIFKSKLGLENITEIKINVKKGVLD